MVNVNKLLESPGGGGGVLNRCLGREVRPGLSNPDPVKDTIL